MYSVNLYSDDKIYKVKFKTNAEKEYYVKEERAATLPELVALQKAITVKQRAKAKKKLFEGRKKFAESLEYKLEEVRE